MFLLIRSPRLILIDGFNFRLPGATVKKDLPLWFFFHLKLDRIQFHLSCINNLLKVTIGDIAPSAISLYASSKITHCSTAIYLHLSQI